MQTIGETLYQRHAHGGHVGYDVQTLENRSLPPIRALNLLNSPPPTGRQRQDSFPYPTTSVSIPAGNGTSISSVQRSSFSLCHRRSAAQRKWTSKREAPGRRSDTEMSDTASTNSIDWNKEDGKSKKEQGNRNEQSFHLHAMQTSLGRAGWHGGTVQSKGNYGESGLRHKKTEVMDKFIVRNKMVQFGAVEDESKANALTSAEAWAGLDRCSEEMGKCNGESQKIAVFRKYAPHGKRIAQMMMLTDELFVAAECSPHEPYGGSIDGAAAATSLREFTDTAFELRRFLPQLGPELYRERLDTLIAQYRPLALAMKHREDLEHQNIQKRESRKKSKRSYSP